MMQLIVNETDTRLPVLLFLFNQLPSVNGKKMENLLPRNDFMIVNHKQISARAILVD